MTARILKQGDVVLDMNRWGRGEAGLSVVLTPEEYNACSAGIILAPITSRVLGHPCEIMVGAGPQDGVVLADCPYRVRQEQVELQRELPPEVVRQLLWTLRALLMDD